MQKKRILVFVVDSGTESHALIKLAEAVTSVPTQHILSRTATNAGRQFQTLENITHKINLKIGGLNHAVEFDCEALDLNRGNVLVIGLDVCHPTGEQRRGQTEEPSFVGITGNYLLHPCAFAGTFFAQESRQESVDPVQLRAKTFEMLERVATYKRKIDTVVLTRDGISEGQYNMALTTELDAIQKACDEYFKHSKTSILGIVVTKSGNVRHFNVSNGRPESLPCRSVVQFGTRENCQQFYMVPHRAFQGTAKAVLVTAIRNDLKIRESDLQNFLMSLTSLHQIVCAPISLPEPIYQADKLAQRGQLVFRTFNRFFPQDIPREGGGQNGPIQFPALTNRIAFNGGALPFIRYTA
jgi:eukaryotic translation initiation factor 2C